MISEVAKLFEDALKLSHEQRAELAGRLLESLDPVVEEHWAQSWEQEVLRRINDLESGQIRSIPRSEACELIERDAE